jgi:hypothetical protein
MATCTPASSGVGSPPGTYSDPATGNIFTNSVIKRRRLPAASWSSIWYLLSSFAVISYTHYWAYVIFAAMGSFIGAYITITFLHPGPTYPVQPPGSAAA